MIRGENHSVTILFIFFIKLHNKFRLNDTTCIPVTDMKYIVARKQSLCLLLSRNWRLDTFLQAMLRSVHMVSCPVNSI